MNNELDFQNSIPQINFDILNNDLEFESPQNVVSIATDYNPLKNKPRINGVELVGNKTTEELGIEASSDYNDLPNKPSINGVELTGNKTTDDLGITDIVDEGNYFNSDNIEGALQEIGGKHKYIYRNNKN